MKKLLKLLVQFRYFCFWLVAMILITLIYGTIYATVQQSLRQSANDPQIQMAEDTAAALANGKFPEEFNTKDKIDIARSLAPYMIVYDNIGRLVASTGQLDGRMPIVPFGVLVTAQKWGKDSVTWQPRPDVRSALVAMPFNGDESGFVVVGRSLRETEIREIRTFHMAKLAWMLSFLAVTFIFFLASRLD